MDGYNNGGMVANEAYEEAETRVRVRGNLVVGDKRVPLLEEQALRQKDELKQLAESVDHLQHKLASVLAPSIPTGVAGKPENKPLVSSPAVEAFRKGNDTIQTIRMRIDEISRRLEC
jgi:hypothetical protein